MLSNQELLVKAPSIFAAAAPSMSDSYTHIPTIQVLELMRLEGFQPYDARQSISRVGNILEAKHMIRLRHAGVVVKNVGDIVFEVVLVNSHDGSCSYQLYGGVHRLVCSNGLITGKNYAFFSIPHRGDVVGNVIEGSYKVISSFGAIQQSIEIMKRLPLVSFEREMLAQEAAQTRASVKDPNMLLMPRRPEDSSNDLWTVMNRIQENLAKGGVGRLRELNGIDSLLSMNTGLWTVADQLKDIKLKQLGL